MKALFKKILFAIIFLAITIAFIAGTEVLPWFPEGQITEPLHSILVVITFLVILTTYTLTIYGIKKTLFRH